MGFVIYSNVKKIVEDILIYDEDYDTHIERIKENLKSRNRTMPLRGGTEDVEAAEEDVDGSLDDTVEFLMENKIEYFDYSKGDNDYKNRWATDSYIFENHILYDKKSIKAFLIGNYLYSFYKIKQELREKKFNVLYSKVKYFLKKNKTG